MLSDKKNIKAYIFDLGGVLINIDPAITLQQIAAYAQQSLNFEDMAHPLHIQFEKGLISAEAFRSAMESLCHVPTQELDRVWNAMLLDFPPARVAFIKALREQFPVYLLSNTNEIHIPAVNEILKAETGVCNLLDLFDKVYYSYEMGSRKPEVACFNQVLQEQGLIPSETLFIDDNFDNITGAQALGIQTLWVNRADTLSLYFNEYFAKN